MNLSLQHNLGGIVLSDGWTVNKALPRNTDATGSQYSTGFIVTHSDGRRAFPKAGMAIVTTGALLR